MATYGRRREGASQSESEYLRAVKTRRRGLVRGGDEDRSLHWVNNLRACMRVEGRRGVKHTSGRRVSEALVVLGSGWLIQLSILPIPHSHEENAAAAAAAVLIPAAPPGR